MTRWQIPVVLAAMAVGAATGRLTDLGDGPQRIVVPALVALLTLTFAGVDRRALPAGLRSHRRVVGAGLGMNFLWAPAVAGLLGWGLLGDHPDLRLGLVMLLVTPCTDWYLAFTAAARGNVVLGASILPVNLVLQLLLLPLFVIALTGAAADIPIGELAAHVAVILGIPLGLAFAARTIAGLAGATHRLDTTLARLEPVGIALLAVAVGAIFAAHIDTIVDEADAFLRLGGPLLAFFTATYLLATAASGKLRFARPERVTLTMTTLARNSPVALAVATAAFPDRPLVAVALVIGPLLELPVLAIAARLSSGGAAAPARAVDRRA